MRAANHIWTGTLALAACAMFAAFSPALAADGEILINQGKVNAGGITPGDTAGFPATLSRPGRYKLSGNLNVPAGVVGIAVTANDVTIDLNGFTIRSNPPGQALTGVFSVFVDGTSVLDGTITGFQNNGVELGARSVVKNMRVLANGIGVSASDNSQISDSTIANNSDRGIDCNSQCLIEGNVITGNTAGIYTANGSGTVIGNVLVGNAGYYGLFSSTTKTGYGENILIENGGMGGPASALTMPLHPNGCDPACP